MNVSIAGLGLIGGSLALALRTGTEDKDIRAHARAIAAFAPRVAAR